MRMTGMLQRCWEHDYCAPSFYMVTIVTDPRRGCLSVLKAPAAAAEKREGPQLRLSPLGAIALDVWRRTSVVYPGVEACECVLMPDHFHGILWVKERLARPMGHIVKAFKRVTELECRSRGLLPPPNPGRGLLPPPNPGRGAAARGPVPGTAPVPGFPTLWQQGFHDSILLHKGQLQAMVQYIADNPRRLAAKLARPDLFTVVTEQTIGPGRTCPMVGNRFLLRHPLKQQVRISRRISPEDLAVKKAQLLYAAEHGTVLVSPCISPGETEIAHAALNGGKPLIVLLANGFSPLFKPVGRYVDACASGRLLMVAPFPYCRRKRPVTREQCLELNAWAQAIVNDTEALKPELLTR